MNFAAQALRNLMYIRVALLFLLVVAGIVLSWLYTSDSLSEKETTSVRYAWMTWFGDTGLGSSSSGSPPRSRSRYLQGHARPDELGAGSKNVFRRRPTRGRGGR